MQALFFVAIIFFAKKFAKCTRDLEAEKYMFSMAFPVKKSRFEEEDEGEFDEDELEKITSNDTEEMRKEPRLVDYDGDLSQRWYVEYYLYDDRIDEWVRKKYSKRLNKFKTATKRRMEAEKIIKAINLKFAKGYYKVQYLKAHVQDNIGKRTIAQAVEWAYQKKCMEIRDNSTRWYRTMKNDFVLWLKKNGLINKKIKDFDAPMIFAYREHLLQRESKMNGTMDGKMSNRSVNNYISNLNSLITFIMDRDHKIFKVHPGAGIRSLPVQVSKKHAVYSKDQLKAIKDECIESVQNQLLLFINFIFYTLARPREIERMKISDIDLQGDRIWIPAENSKNKMGDYINLVAPLKRLIMESGILEYPKHFYIFTAKGTPGENHPYDKYFWRKHKKVLDKLNIREDGGRKFDLYSYKHSGAVNLYLQTKDIIAISQQCRHQTLDQTKVYLRDLDLFRDKSIINIEAAF